MNPFQQQSTFHQNYTTNETYFYSQNNFDNSPLNKIEKSLAPGNSWVGANKGIEVKNVFNTINDQIKVVIVSDITESFGSYGVGVNYDPGTLFKTITIDEHQKQIIEFKDRNGNVILKKVQLTSSNDPGSGISYDGWLSTCYVYDDFQRLRLVIQPKGFTLLRGNGWVFNGAILDEHCFRYEYDDHNRLIRKKVPGAAEVEMVYDNRDRLILSRDGNLKANNKWNYTKYDNLNRPIYSGILNSPLTRKQHQDLAITLSYPTLTVGSFEELQVNFYDNYDWLSSYSTGLSSTLDQTTDGSGNGNLLSPSTTTFPYPEALVQSNKIVGLNTGSRTKVLGSLTYLYSVNFYDQKGRLIQNQSINSTGGKDISTTQYSHAGNPIVIVQKTAVSSTINQTYIVASIFQYDDLNRLIKTEKVLNGKVGTTNYSKAKQEISKIEYDELSQAKNKVLAPQFNNNLGLESLKYDYNIRGWLTGINKSFLNSGQSYFGMELNYDKDGFSANPSKQYNGNIGSMIWRSKGDNEVRKFDYSYDAANRLLKSDFNQLFGSTWSKTNPSGNGFLINFSTFMGDGSNPSSAYDENGNILKMKQWGLKLTSSEVIDDLIYDYINSGNKLSKVTDAGVVLNFGDFKDGTNGTLDDYAYDANGNLVFDKNKNINASNGIIYNHLNLPSIIAMENKGNIAYTYDGAGNKLKKTVLDLSSSETIETTTFYINGLVFESRTHTAKFTQSDPLYSLQSDPSFIDPVF